MLHAQKLLAVFGLTLDATPEAAHRVAAGLKQEGYIKLSTTLHELGKGAAAALLAHADSEQQRVRLIERCIEMAAEHRAALGVLTGLTPYREGWRPASHDDARPHFGAAVDHEDAGRILLGLCERAAGEDIALRAELGRLDSQMRTEGERTNQTIAMHQRAGGEMATLINEAHEALDALGVPRLPAPWDRSIAVRIAVLVAQMRGPVLVATGPS